MDKLIAQQLAKEAYADNSVLVNQVSPLTQNKYHVAPVEERTQNGVIFASKSEMRRYNELVLLQRGHQIKDLQTQVPFILQEGFTHPQYGEINHLIYVADFVYTNLTLHNEYLQRQCVEDSKGMVTAVYKLKRKLFLKKYPEYLFFEV